MYDDEQDDYWYDDIDADDRPPGVSLGQLDRQAIPYGISVPEHWEDCFESDEDPSDTLRFDEWAAMQFDNNDGDPFLFHFDRPDLERSDFVPRRHRFLRKHRRHELLKNVDAELPALLSARWLARFQRKWHGPPRRGRYRVSGCWKDVSRRARQYKAN